jgi:hypothetical protein
MWYDIYIYMTLGGKWFLRAEHRLRVLERTVVGEIFGLKMKRSGLHDEITRSFVVYAPHQTVSGRPNQGSTMDGETE